MKRKLKLLVITSLLLLLSSLTLMYGQEVNKEINLHKVEKVAVNNNYNANKVIKKKSKQVISIRAYRKSLKIRVKTIKLC